MVKPPGKCIFCDGAGLTKQHIWPEWVTSVHPQGRAPRHASTQGLFRTFTPLTEVAPPHVKVRQGHTWSRKVRRVCKTCNSGWMSQIEQRAKRVAEPLINGALAAVDATDQRCLAAWCALVTTVYEFAEPVSVSISAEHRKWLMERREPPDDWRIWLARYHDGNADLHRCRHTAMTVRSSPDEGGYRYKCNTQVTTFVIGHFCAHVYSSTVWTDFEGYEGIKLQQIWPLPDKTFNWLAVPIISDREIISLNEALAASLIPLP